MTQDSGKNLAENRRLQYALREAAIDMLAAEAYMLQEQTEPQLGSVLAFSLIL